MPDTRSPKARSPKARSAARKAATKKAPKKPNPKKHDQLFKKLLTFFFPDFVSLIHPQLAGRLSLERTQFDQQEVFADASAIGPGAEVDLVARVPRQDDGEQYILTHIEVQGKKGSEMGRRLWRYHMALQLRSELPVLSVVVYLKGGQSTVHWEVYEEKVLEDVVSTFRYLEFGLSASHAAAYLERAEPLAWALAALMKPTGSRAQTRLECVRRIMEATVPDLGRRLLYDCVVQYLPLRGAEQAEYEALLNQLENGKTKEDVMTWSEKLEAKGKKEGKIEGKKEGKLEGKLEGKIEGKKEGKEEGLRESVSEVLMVRFGRLTDSLRQRIDSLTDLSALNRLLRQAATASSLDELETTAG